MKQTEADMTKDIRTTQTTVREYRYNDGVRDGWGQPRLWLIKQTIAGARAKQFLGGPIKGWCRIASIRFNGQCDPTSTDYALELGLDVTPVFLLARSGRAWGSHYTSWADAACYFGVPEALLRRIVRIEYPSDADRLDGVETD